MPSWPSLYPGILDGKTNMALDVRSKDMKFEPDQIKDYSATQVALTSR